MSEHPDGPRGLRSTVRPWSKHIISFFWEGFEPHLTALDLEDGSLEEMELGRLGMEISEEKVCIGSFDDDGVHHPCPFKWRVNVFSQCNRCAEERTPD